MVNYWFCVTSQENWDLVRRKKVWGVSERYRRKMAKVKIGDLFVFYVKKQGLAGIFKVISEPFENHEELFETRREGEVFPLRVRLEAHILPEEIVPLDKLSRKLKLLSRGHWALQLAMREISKDEYETIRNLLS